MCRRHVWGAIIVVLIAFGRPAAAQSYSEGQAVAAMYGSEWYVATVDGEKQGKFQITYSDGSEATVTADRLRPMSESAQLAPGDRVVAVWKDGGRGRMYPGTIVARADRGFTIRWEDNSTSVAKLGKIAKLAAAALLYQVGDSVAARWRTSNDWYLATIESISGGMYKVKYADGSRATLAERDLREIAKPRELAIGDRVLAVWGTGGKMYPGMIQARGQEGFTVRWEDGSTSAKVPARQIAKQTGAPVTATTTSSTTIHGSTSSTTISSSSTISTSSSTSTSMSFDRQACVDWAYEGYQKSYASGPAREHAHKACNTITDLAIARELYTAYAKSYASGVSVTKAAEAPYKQLVGKLELLQFAIVGYAKSYASGVSADKAIERTKNAQPSIMRCLRGDYEAFNKSYASGVAMDKAFEVCNK
jgi:hypothetical protein